MQGVHLTTTLEQCHACGDDVLFIGGKNYAINKCLGCQSTHIQASEATQEE